MELEQVNKQVDWLDKERQKDKLKIGSLEEKLSTLEVKIAPLEHQLKDLSGEITRLAATLARMDGFDESILQIRIETKQQFEDQDKQTKKHDEDFEKARRTEIRSLETSIGELRKETEQFPEIKRNLKLRMDEEIRLSRMIDEVRNRIETMRRSEEEYTRTIRLLDDGRRQDSKRLTDLSGEISAVRKRTDDHSGRLDLTAPAMKKLEARLNELAAVESERREAISNFMDSQALRDVERERIWKEWQTRFEQVETQAADIESSLQALDATQRAVKRSQQTVDELTQKVERRVSEITEIQRLAEERFRQEWVTFKSDDQKRWTNYTLTMEEQRGEAVRQHEKLVEKVIHLEDEIQEFQDLIQQMNQHTEKRLQSLLAMAHEWVSSYERTVGRAR
jgi:predicted  nucleic acid-binding Zn-ribbon protein